MNIVKLIFIPDYLTKTVLVRYSMSANKIMKTILVDAVSTFVSDKGEIFQEMFQMLESYPNRKIVVSGANDEQFKTWKLDTVPYEVFTMKHNPEKTNPKYFAILLEKYGLKAEGAIYFEHNPDAVKSAELVGIVSYFYDENTKDLVGLKSFLDTNL